MESIEILQNMTDEIDQTICSRMFSYHKVMHFGATSFGKDIVNIDGRKVLCWYGEYDMGYALKVNLGKSTIGTTFDFIKVMIEFGTVFDTHIDFVNIENKSEYVLHISMYNQKIKSGDWTDGNLVEIDTFVGTFGDIIG